ncbi:hypothetical protein MUP37_03725 [Candidatus Bathyarchaeota archaeon]|nr:hypothetical protein [Candidatus Bathyarchaeota archaeon]
MQSFTSHSESSKCVFIALLLTAFMVNCVLGAPASQFEVAKITGTILPPSLTVHVQPTSATINLGQSVPFTSTVQGGTPRAP